MPTKDKRHDSESDKINFQCLDSNHQNSYVWQFKLSEGGEAVDELKVIDG